MSGIGSVLPGLVSNSGGGGGGGPVREPTSGDYYDASNRVTQTSAIGINPPGSTYSRTVFRWAGVNVYDSGNVFYPVVAPNQITVGPYTYYAGLQQSSTGGDPNTQTFGIYRTTP